MLKKKLVLAAVTILGMVTALCNAAWRVRKYLLTVAGLISVFTNEVRNFSKRQKSIPVKFRG